MHLKRSTRHLLGSKDSINDDFLITSTTSLQTLFALSFDQLGDLLSFYLLNSGDGKANALRGGCLGPCEW